MIQVLNVGQYRVALSSSYTGVQGRPLYINLGPGQNRLMTQEELKNWGGGSKEALASYVQSGLLQVSQLTSVHIVNDTGHVPTTFSAFDVPSACDTADYIRLAYNDHIMSVAVHSAADVGNLESSAKPTDLATLTAFIVSLQGNYNAHIAAGVHPVADALNAVSAATGTLQQDIAALKELYGRFSMHKKQCTAGTVMNPNQIITF